MLISEIEFQSLFRWITFPDNLTFFRGEDVTLFQSLFRWITFPDTARPA